MNNLDKLKEFYSNMVSKTGIRFSFYEKEGKRSSTLYFGTYDFLSENSRKNNRNISFAYTIKEGDADEDELMIYLIPIIEKEEAIVIYDFINCFRLSRLYKDTIDAFIEYLEKDKEEK